MSAFGPTSAPVAARGVLGFSEAWDSHKIDYNGRNAPKDNRWGTFETQLTHSVKSGASRIGSTIFAFWPAILLICRAGSPESVCCYSDHGKVSDLDTTRLDCG